MYVSHLKVYIHILKWPNFAFPVLATVNNEHINKQFEKTACIIIKMRCFV